MHCDGAYISGLCDTVVQETSPGSGIYKIFCSCDGENPTICCHLEATANSNTGVIDYEASGLCWEGGCPGDLNDTCKKVGIEVWVDGELVTQGVAPKCKSI